MQMFDLYPFNVKLSVIHFSVIWNVSLASVSHNTALVWVIGAPVMHRFLVVIAHGRYDVMIEVGWVGIIQQENMFFHASMWLANQKMTKKHFGNQEDMYLTP